MKRVIALSLALCMLFAATACAAKSADSAPMAAPAAEAPKGEMEYAAYDAAEFAMMEETAANSAAGATQQALQSMPAEGGAADADTRKIVYNANMEITADDPAAAVDAIIERAIQLGGYLADSYTTNDEQGAWRSSATIKVPAEALDELVTAAKALGKVDDYQLSSDDITLRYYDIDARLNSAKAEEKQLLEILNRCETVEEILAVRESLATVRSDIESYQGQINLWDNLVSYATLSISIHRTPQPEVAREKELLTIWKASDVWKRMSRGFVNGARAVVNAVSAIGIFLAATIIPAAVLFMCVGLPVLFVRKRRREKAEAAGEPASPTMAEMRRARKQEKRDRKRAKRGKPLPAEGTDAGKSDEPEA